MISKRGMRLNVVKHWNVSSNAPLGVACSRAQNWWFGQFLEQQQQRKGVAGLHQQLQHLDKSTEVRACKVSKLLGFAAPCGAKITRNSAVCMLDLPTHQCDGLLLYTIFKLVIRLRADCIL